MACFELEVLVLGKVRQLTGSPSTQKGHGVKETSADPVVGLIAFPPPFIRMGQSGARSSLVHLSHQRWQLDPYGSFTLKIHLRTK